MFSGSPSPRARTASRVAIAILVLAGLLVAAELGLRAAGVGDPWQRFERRAGLNDGARYLAPDELVPGGWRTQMFGDASKEVLVPPRDARARILILGGASASAIPGPALAVALDAAQTGRGHEVISLARADYGAERLLILLREALPALKPDVVVVSMGQHEFFEPGLGADVARGDGPTALEQLRVANWLASLGETPTSRVPWEGGPDPEPVRPWEEGAELTHATGDAIYATFGRFVDEMVAETRAAGVRLVLCTSPANMLAQPSLPGHSEPLSPEQAAEFARLREQVHAALPLRLVGGLIRLGPDLPPLHMSLPMWGPESLVPGAPAPKKASRGRKAPPLRALAAPWDTGAQWSDPEYWDPLVHLLMGTVQQFHERQLSPEERASVEQAVQAAQQAVALSPGHAHAVFELGLALYLSGDEAGGVAWLRDAQTLDLRPNRANDRTNGQLRAAAASPGVALADVDGLLRGASPDGLVGYELMADACHMHVAARDETLRVVVAAILQP
jgi:hypothetical protein